MMIVIQRCYCLWLSLSPLPPAKLTQKNLMQMFHYSSPFSFDITSRNIIFYQSFREILLLFFVLMLANRSSCKRKPNYCNPNYPSLFFMRERATHGLYFVSTWSNVAVPDNKTRFSNAIRNSWWFARKENVPQTIHRFSSQARTC